MVGTMQFFTATLLLVGWAWSLVWGIYMVILAGKNNHSRRFQHFIYNYKSKIHKQRRAAAKPAAYKCSLIPYLFSIRHYKHFYV